MSVCLVSRRALSCAPEFSDLLATDWSVPKSWSGGWGRRCHHCGGPFPVQCYIPAVAKHRAVNPCFGPQLPLLRLTKKDVPVVGGEAGLLLRGGANQPRGRRGRQRPAPLKYVRNGQLVRRFGCASNSA